MPTNSNINDDNNDRNYLKRMLDNFLRPIRPTVQKNLI